MEAKLGITTCGESITKTYGISQLRQFIDLYIDVARYGTYADEYHFLRLYLPEHRGKRALHFPSVSETALITRTIIKHCSQDDADILSNKSHFAAKCREHALPTPAILAEFENGVMTCGSTPFPSGDLFSKPAARAVGDGARLWRDGTFSAVALIETLCEQSKGRYGLFVLQPRLINHPDLQPLTNGALCTLRLVTCRSLTGEIDLLPPVIRMPNGDSVVDNLAKGGLAAPIDIASGMICGPGIKKHAGLGSVTIDRHPDTGTRFEGFQIPSWRDALDLARRAHRVFPSMIFIGWDIPILPEGPILLEGNPVWDTNLTVMPHGITLSDTQFVPCYNEYLRTLWSKIEGSGG